MTATPWYLDPITQQFNGASEKGVDLGVPYHTPVTPLFPGVVTGVKTGPYGQEVDVAGQVKGQQVTSSYVHIDQALVAVGQPVTQATTLGLSGGQLAGGYHPASPAYSSGPHIEFSLWPSGTTPYVGTPYNPMNLIKSVQGNPTAVLGSLNGGNTAAATSSVNASLLQELLAAMSNTANIPNPFGPVSGAVQGATSQPIVNIQMPSIGQGIADGFTALGQSFLGHLGASSLSDLLWRAGLLLVALVLLIVVAQAITMKGTQTVVESVTGVKPSQVPGAVKGLAG